MPVYLPSRRARKKLTYCFHVNTFSISPFVPKILVQLLFGGLWYFVKADKVLDDSQISVKTGRTRIKSLDDSSEITKYGGVHESCGKDNPL